MVAAVAHKRISSQSAEVSEFEADVLEGLSAAPKHVPAKYFYDAAGSQLFERITELPEYYPTRCEISILRDHGADTVSVASLDYVLDRDNPLFARLESFLRQ